MTAGTTYYYQVGYYDSDSSGDIDVSLSRSVSTGSVSAVVKTAGKPARLRFTPSELGTYDFSSSGSSSAKAYLYDASGVELASDVDGGGFSISSTLYSGSVYYYDVCYYSSSSTGTISATLERGEDPTPIDGEVDKYLAYVVGNVNYDEELPGPDNDANAMTAMLQGLTSPYNVTTMYDRSASEIVSDVNAAFSGATSDSISLFYYSGHGVGSASTQMVGALCGVDGSYLTTAQLADTLANVPGKVVVILDSCYSGAAITEMNSAGGSKQVDLDDVNQQIIDVFAAHDPGLETGVSANAGELRQSKFYVITASSAYETSQSVGYGDIWGGLFTREFLEGLGCEFPSGSYSGSMPADNGDLLVTLGEAYAYARSNVTEHTVQCYGETNQVLFKRK